MLVKKKHSLAIRNIRSHKCKQLGLLQIRSSFLPKRSQFANADLVNSHYSTKYKRMFWPAIALFVNKLGAGYKRSGLVLFRLLKSLNFSKFHPFCISEQFAFEFDRCIHPTKSVSQQVFAITKLHYLPESFLLAGWNKVSSTAMSTSDESHSK